MSYGSQTNHTSHMSLLLQKAWTDLCSSALHTSHTHSQHRGGSAKDYENKHSMAANGLWLQESLSEN